MTHNTPKSANMNSVRHWKVFCKLKAEICREWSDLRNEQMFFIHNNVHPYSSEFMMAFFSKMG